MLKTNGLSAVIAELRAHRIEGSATVAKRFAWSQGIHLDRRAAILTVRPQIVQPLQPAALALPVADLKFDEIKGGRLPEVLDRKNRPEHRLKTGVLPFFRQKIHL